MSVKKRAWLAIPMLVILSLALYPLVGKYKPKPLSKDQIPGEVRELLEASDDTWEVGEVEYFVFEPEGDEYVVVAVASILQSWGERANFLRYARAKGELGPDGNLVWTLVSDISGKGYSGGRGSHKWLNTEYPNSVIGVVPGQRRTVGWALDPKVAKIEVTCFTGETVTVRIVNGFWWTEPYDWYNNWPRQKTVAYDTSGKVLYVADMTEK